MILQAMELHRHIQDCFNEYGVQIMSPHYVETLRRGRSSRRKNAMVRRRDRSEKRGKAAKRTGRSEAISAGRGVSLVPEGKGILALRNRNGKSHCGAIFFLVSRRGGPQL